MTKPSKEDYAAIHRLKSSKEFQLFITMLNADLAQTDLSGRRLEGTELFRNQGRALYIESLLEMIDKSGEVLTKFNSQNP